MMDDARSSLRIITLQVLVLLSFVFLGLKLWQLQIDQHERYIRLADTNRFRLVTVDPPRGVIYDRTGQILVRNVPSFTLSVVPAGLPKDEERLAQLGDQIAVMLRQPPLLADAVDWGGRAWADDADRDVEAGGDPLPTTQEILDSLREIRDKVARGQLSAYSPVSLITKVSREVAFIAEEKSLDLPGLVVEIKPLRHYLEGALIAHWLGYVGPIPQESVQSYLAQPGADYVPSDQVGLAGVERTYESELRGSKAKKHVEVNVMEREMGVLATRPGSAGNSLVLTLDLELQRAATEALQARMDTLGADSGSAIAMNPQTGEVLAMVSLPSYDNNLFSGGISAQDFQRLMNDPLSPLLNHAIGGEYPPGSTFKIVPACAALEEGVITPKTTFTCQGMMWLPNEFMPDDRSQDQPFYCWSAHGNVNLERGLAYSCDIYFYHVGGGFLDRFQGLGLARLADYTRTFGFGERTGIRLTGEAIGLVPTERWKRETWDTNWVTGDTYNVSIGQGYILATPLQVLNSVAAVANGGTLYRPQVVQRVLDSEGNEVQHMVPEVIRQVPISPENILLVRDALRSTVRWGTANRLEAALPEIRAAGKTGTAEFPGELDEKGNLPTVAWFGGFAPYDDPEIAVIVFIGEGGGALDAVPVASEILRHYFQIPEPTPTPIP